jgi:hypothetical protein
MAPNSPPPSVKVVILAGSDLAGRRLRLRLENHTDDYLAALPNRPTGAASLSHPGLETPTSGGLHLAIRLRGPAEQPPVLTARVLLPADLFANLAGAEAVFVVGFNQFPVREADDPEVRLTLETAPP